MAKTTAPLLSFDGSGQIGKTQVYAKWKGRGYARRYTIPANPKTAGQTLTRATFSYINDVWKFGSTELQQAFVAFAKGKVLTDRNAVISTNLKTLRTALANTGILVSPGANGGIAATSIGAVDATGQVATVTMGVPAVPTGWTITDSVAVLIPSGTYNAVTGRWEDAATDPLSPTTYAGASGDATGSVSVNAIAGDFVVSGYFKMTKPDGTTAYGEALDTTVTLA